MFDTLAYANKLTEAGFTSEQAKAQAGAMVSVVNENLTTKQDLKELEVSLKHDTELVKQDIKELEVSLRHGMALHEMAIKFDIKQLENKFEGELKDLKGEFTGLRGIHQRCSSLKASLTRWGNN